MSVMSSLAVLLVLSCSAAFEPSALGRDALWDTRQKKWVALDQVRVVPGEIYVLGEQHANKDNAHEPEIVAHHRNQVRWLEHVSKMAPVSVGMEFLAYPAQGLVEEYLAGKIEEAAFLAGVGWGASPFEFYREQVLFPRNRGGTTLALNMPSQVSRKVSQGGPENLTKEDKKLLPPIWERGGSDYFARFHDTMKDHAPPHAIENYFWAQSLWDDTMAWRAVSRPQASVLTIIVGEFHTVFGHGLPARLQRYEASVVKSIVQRFVGSWTEESLRSAVQADPNYGEQADLIWVNALEQH